MELRRIDRLISKSANFEDLFEELKNNKSFVSKFVGDVFERLTQAYLLTLPQYRSILEEVWLYDDIPRKLLKDLNLPTKDFGIDLLAKTKKGEYWTIQSKFRSTTDALTFDDLSTFNWLGTGTIASHLMKFRDFQKARAYVQSLGLKNRDEWRAYIKSDKKPKDIPSNPNTVYKDQGWVGYRDWLGNYKN